MMIPDDTAGHGALLEEAARELEAAIHDARVAFDCIGLGEIDRAHTSAVTARVAIDAALTAVQAALPQAGSRLAGDGPIPGTDLRAGQ
jgi:hypothetical protein